MAYFLLQQFNLPEDACHRVIHHFCWIRIYPGRHIDVYRICR